MRAWEPLGHAAYLGGRPSKSTPGDRLLHDQGAEQSLPVAWEHAGQPHVVSQTSERSWECVRDGLWESWVIKRWPSCSSPWLGN